MNRDALEGKLRQALNRLVQTSERLIVAVSGGSDSMALLHLICAVRGTEGVHVAFVDHGLRAGVDKEWELVHAACVRLGVGATRFWIRERYGETANGEGIQQWARNHRYTLLLEAAAQFGASAIATGHTLDDQAETVLLRMLRGTGVDGLGAIPGSRELQNGVRVIRPLLHLSRQSLRDWLTTRGILWADDPGNENLRYTRVQVRQILPSLEDCNPRIREHLGALAEEAQALSQWLDESLLLENDIISLVYLNGCKVNYEVFERLPIGLRGRVVRKAIYSVCGNLLRLEREHIDSVVDGIVERGRSRRHDFPGLIDVRTAYGDLYVFPRSVDNAPDFSSQPIVLLPSGEWTGNHAEMGVSVSIRPATDNLESNYSLDTFSKQLFTGCLRPLRPGDRLWGSARKAAPLLNDSRVPVFYRPLIPVLASKDEVISIPGILKSRISGLHLDWQLDEVSPLRDLGAFVQF